MELFDVVLLGARAIFGFILISHGLQKLFGWLSGPGFSASVTMFEGMGHRPAALMVVASIGGELVAGSLIILGFFSGAAAALAVATLLVASLSMIRRGRNFWNARGGGEYPFVLAVGIAVVGLVGPGAYALNPAWAQLRAGIDLALLGLAALGALAIFGLSVVNSRRHDAAA